MSLIADCVYGPCFTKAYSIDTQPYSGLDILHDDTTVLIWPPYYYSYLVFDCLPVERARRTLICNS